MARNLLSTLALLGLQSIGFGQSATLSVGSGSGTPGGTVSFPINLTSSGGAQAAGLQWSFSFSPDVTGVTVVAGASTTNAGKSLLCSGSNCLIVGFNSAVIADGTVALATFQIAASPSSNPVLIQITNVLATTALGTSTPLSGGSGKISLPVSVSLDSLNCASLTINTPGTSSCTVSLTGAAPAGGLSVSLLSNNVYLTLPPSVTVAPGQTSYIFTATSAQVSGNQTAIVTASAGGVNLSNTLTLNLARRLSNQRLPPRRFPDP